MNQTKLIKISIILVHPQFAAAQGMRVCYLRFVVKLQGRLQQMRLMDVSLVGQELDGHTLSRHLHDNVTLYLCKFAVCPSFVSAKEGNKISSQRTMLFLSKSSDYISLPTVSCSTHFVHGAWHLHSPCPRRLVPPCLAAVSSWSLPCVSQPAHQ